MNDARAKRVQKLLAADPPRHDRMKVEWNKICDLLAPYFVAAMLKSFEAHMLLDRARSAFFEQIEAGTPEKHIWIYAMHAAGCPAAPRPKRKGKI